MTPETIFWARLESLPETDLMFFLLFLMRFWHGLPRVSKGGRTSAPREYGNPQMARVLDKKWGNAGMKAYLFLLLFCPFSFLSHQNFVFLETVLVWLSGVTPNLLLVIASFNLGRECLNLWEGVI